MTTVILKTRRIGRRIRIVLGTILMLLGLFGWASFAPQVKGPIPAALASAGNVLRVPAEYATIQAAVNVASAGDTINVAAGVYNENVVIAVPGLRLHASSGAVVDGAGLTGSGILVLGTAAEPVTDVEVSGFEVRDFQRGIVLEFATLARIRGNEVHDNTKLPGPLTALDQGVGIDLVTAHFSEVSENSVSNNGARGIGVRMGSTNNVLRANRIDANGALMAATMGGTGITVTGQGTNDNRIVANEILGNFGRGVMLSRPAGTAPITGNLVTENRLHDNQRAGICIMLAAQDNYILQNDARNNNLSGLPPCLTFNLFDDAPVDNIWERNLGTSNFGSL